MPHYEVLESETNVLIWNHLDSRESVNFFKQYEHYQWYASGHVSYKKGYMRQSHTYIQRKKERETCF